MLAPVLLCSLTCRMTVSGTGCEVRLLPLVLSKVQNGLQNLVRVLGRSAGFLSLGPDRLEIVLEDLDHLVGPLGEVEGPVADGERGVPVEAGPAAVLRDGFWKKSAQDRRPCRLHVQVLNAHDLLGRASSGPLIEV